MKGEASKPRQMRRAIASLVAEYVDRWAELLNSLDSPGVRPHVQTSPGSLTLRLPPKEEFAWYVGIPAAILDVLPKDLGFSSPWQITERIFDHIKVEVGPEGAGLLVGPTPGKGSLEVVPLEIADSLLRGQHEYFFQVPMAAAGPPFLEGWASGAGELLLFRREGNAPVLLAGSLRAAARLSFADRAEERLRQVLGLLTALDIAEIQEPTFREKERLDLKSVHLTWDDDEWEESLAPSLSDLVDRVALRVPMDWERTDIERKMKPKKVFDGRMEIAKKAFKESGDAAVVRTAAGFLVESLECRDVPGKAVLLGTIGLESLLMAPGSKENVTVKLREFVAAYLGKSPGEAAALRDDVGDIYEARSRFVHEGRWVGEWRLVEGAQGLVRQCLRKRLLELG